MFGRYALPTDDYAGNAGIMTASSGDEDPEYVAENMVATSDTGHLNLPSRPAKLLTAGPAYWEKSFDVAITVIGAALIYHNFDPGLDVTIEAGPAGSPTSFSVPVPIPAHHEDDWTVSPWVLFDSPQTYSAWRLSVNAANSLNLQVGRWMLLGALRQLSSDVRWGVEEQEEHGLIEHATELGVETMYDLGGKRRSFAGEFALLDSAADELIRLYRTARSRIQPWLLIPDEDVNDAWLVRFEEPRWSRTREVPNHNIFPYRVRELSRGLPWP